VQINIQNFTVNVVESIVWELVGSLIAIWCQRQFKADSPLDRSLPRLLVWRAIATAFPHWVNAADCPYFIFALFLLQ